nr:hypothetical protein GCM10020092_053880 [Actinoplanes digitatis]
MLRASSVLDTPGCAATAMVRCRRTARPPPSLRAADQAELELARFHLELRDALRLTLTTALLGALPRP